MNITLKLEIGIETAVVVSSLEDKAELMDQAGPSGIIYAQVARRLAAEIQQKMIIRASHGTLTENPQS